MSANRLAESGDACGFGRSVRAAAIAAAFLLAATGYTRAQPQAAGAGGEKTAGAATQETPAASGTVVLDTFSSWRMYHVLKSPEIALDGAVKPAVFEHYWLNRESPPPPDGWTKPEFDDAEWLRSPVPMSAKTAFVSRACFRGRFRVTDPAAVKKLTLAVDYQGGVIVYVNGQEVRRSHLPEGPKPALAEPYPLEAFAGPDGVLLANEREMVMVGGQMKQAGKPSDETLRRMDLQKRSVAAVEIPASLLRRGVNVLAIEAIRSPYHKIVDERKTGTAQRPVYDLHWNTCQVLGIRLTAGGASGLEVCPWRPAGFQVWNGTVLRSDFELDFGDPCEDLKPVVLGGPRNGTYSGKVVAGSSKPFKGLKAAATDLKGAGGTIPASAIRIRYGDVGTAEYGSYEHMYGLGTEGKHPAKIASLSTLKESPPAQATVQLSSSKPQPGVKAGPGPVVPVWLTVKVPADAKPGAYEGTLTVEAGGEKPVTTPVKLEVQDWALPDSYDFRTWVELIQSPDTLQLEYNLDPWSPKHLEYIARSMRFLRDVGSGVLYLPLLAETNYGNTESIVRWIKKPLDRLGAGGEKQYEFDYANLDKYLDTAQKVLGKPKVACFIIWEVYLLEKGDKSRIGLGLPSDRPTSPLVTFLDPATGKCTNEAVPNTDDPAMKPVWQALFTELHKRFKARGWEDAMMIGCMCDSKPSKSEIAFWHDVTGDLPWVSHSHWPTSNKYYYGKVLGSGFKTGYMTSIYEVNYPVADPAKGPRLYGWKNPLLHAQNIRAPELGLMPGTMVRSFGEEAISGTQRGFGRLGGDYWAAIKDKTGRRTGKAYERFPQSTWGNLVLKNNLLAPGPEGAVATARYELLREGLQECEARIFLEQSLTTEGLRARLGDELAKKAQDLLDERTLCVQRAVANLETNCYGYCVPWNWVWQEGVAGHVWFQSSGWRERTANLFTMAGEVARKVAAK